MLQRKLVIGFGLLVCAARILAAAPAGAGSLQISPVRLALSVAKPIEAITVRNDGADTMVVQMEAMSWTQKDGEDLYAPTKDLVATPPIFTIRPGAMQIVRVGLRRPTAADQELAFRLYFQEVGASRPEGSALKVLLRLGVPVFVSPRGDTKPVFAWAAVRQSDDLVRIDLRNSGNAHLRIATLSLMEATAGELAPVDGKAKYVLAQQTRSWLFQRSAALPAHSRLRLTAATNVGEVHADLPWPQP